MLNTIKNNANFESLPIGAATVMAGTAAAADMGNFDFFTAVICMLFILLLQLFGNLLHRYSLTIKEWGDGVARYMNMQDTKDFSHRPTEILKAAATGVGILTGMVGLFLLQKADGKMWIWALAALIVVYMYLNSFGPRPLSRTPFSLLTTFIMFGPVGVISTTYIQASFMAVDPISWNDLGPAVACSIITGLYAVGPQICYNIRNYDFDVHHGRTTPVTMWGLKTGLALLIINGIIAGVIAIFASLRFSPNRFYIPIIIFWVTAAVNIYGSVMSYRNRNNAHSKYYLILNWQCLIAMTLFFVYSMVWGEADTRAIEIF